MTTNVVQLSKQDEHRNTEFANAIREALEAGVTPERAAEVAWTVALKRTAKNSHLAALELGASPAMVYMIFSATPAKNQQEAKQAILRRITSDWELHWNAGSKRFPGAPDATLRKIDGTANIEVEIKARGDVIAPHQIAFSMAGTWVMPRIIWVFPGNVDMTQ